MHNANCAAEQKLVLRPVDVLRQGYPHAFGQGQHAQQIVRVLVMVLQPPHNLPVRERQVEYMIVSIKGLIFPKAN